MVNLARITQFLDDLLHIAKTPDYPNALNGVQVETSNEISGIAAAVDARLETILGTQTAGMNLLLVHHGLFWGGLQPLRGVHLRRIRALLTHDIGLYSAHLPLDAHPAFGNNVLLAHQLGLTPMEGFARFQTLEVGVMGEADLPTREIIDRAERFARQWGGSIRQAGANDANRITRRWAICTGNGATSDTLHEAAYHHIDTLIVGEGPHWTAVDAGELGLAIIYAGHYATETLGVRALAECVGQEFSLPWKFIDVPTGL